MKVFSNKNHVLSKKYLGLIAVLATVSMGTVFAVTEYIQMDGSYNITGDLLVNGNLTGPTITDFDDRIDVLEFATGTVVILSSTTITDAIYDLEERVSAIEGLLEISINDGIN